MNLIEPGHEPRLINSKLDKRGKMTFGSLFSGIGGIDIGLERAGFKPLWQCEINKFCRELLRKHWPNVKLYGDIRDIDEKTPRPDVLCGGFPCQDISTANTKGKGLDGSKSGLWFEFYRVIRLLRPRYVLVENVSNLVNKGLDRILQGLAEIGYDAEWQVLSAAQFGAWHLRRRIFIVAYPNRLHGEINVEAEFDLEWTNNGVQTGWSKSSNTSQRCRPSITPADPTSQPHRRQNNTPGCEVVRADTSGQREEKNASSPGDCGQKTFSHTNRIFAGGTNQTLCGREGWMGFGFGGNRQYVRNPPKAMADPDGSRCEKQRRTLTVFPEQFASKHFSWWDAKPGICRVYDGIPNRVDRLKSLGNAVVPQVAEYLGKLILNRSRRACEASGQDAHSYEPY